MRTTVQEEAATSEEGVHDDRGEEQVPEIGEDGMEIEREHEVHTQ